LPKIEEESIVNIPEIKSVVIEEPVILTTEQKFEEET
jgi:hypothetical protein